ncbi:hypothetical protein F5Y13DRAFT_153071 [Hypoxylon sp. FL1857]|nr:hypothetical protein F5Y13DRAFT_153071 [Hypoxylon sp. FL1857]
MADSESSVSSISSPLRGVIKVYATDDGSSEDWTRPRRIHLHERISPTTLVCCESVMAGGIVEDQGGKLLYLTSDTFVPRGSRRREKHADTGDGCCTCIGRIKHTSRTLHYALITINESVANSEDIATAKNLRVAVSGQRSYEVAMHPSLIRYHHRESDLAVLARTQYNDVFIGRIKTLPTTVVRPCFLGSSDLMVAVFDARLTRKPEVGMWVYARRPGTTSRDSRVREMLEELDVGSYPPETFSYRSDYHSFRHGNPLILVGHIVDVRDSAAGQGGQVEATIQSAYEVLTEIFVQNGRLNNPDGAEPIPAGIDPRYVEMLSEPLD